MDFSSTLVRVPFKAACRTEALTKRPAQRQHQSNKHNSLKFDLIKAAPTGPFSVSDSKNI